MQKFISSSTFTLLVFLMIAGCSQRDKRSLIVSEVQKVSKLATTEYVLGKLIIGKKEKRFLRIIRLSEAGFVAETQATVKAGIDLAKLQPGDVTINGTSIELKLPAIEVLNFSYPLESFKVNSKLTDQGEKKFKMEDIENLIEEAELEIRRDLHYLDIESNTQKSTRTMLTQLLKKFGYEDVFISFEPMDNEEASVLQQRLEELRGKFGDNV